MRAILFLNGDAPVTMPNTSGAFVVCADGAYNYLADRLLPNVLVGDFDSIDIAQVDSAVEIVRFPIEKDFTDGELAIELIAERGYRDIEIYGATGGRPDHELCNYSLLAYARARGVSAAIVTDRFTVRLIDGEYSGVAEKGKIISLVPFGDKTHILYTKGLKYRAEQLTVDKVHIVSVSNAAIGGRFSVSVQGLTLLFVER